MVDAKDKVHIGVVCWFQSKTGIGFITPDDGSKDMFVHYSNVAMEGFKNLRQGQKVQYKIGQNHRGDQAVEVKVVE